MSKGPSAASSLRSVRSGRYSPCPGSEVSSQNGVHIRASKVALVQQYLGTDEEVRELDVLALKGLTLHECARNGDSRKLTLLLADKRRAKQVNKLDDDGGLSPLHYAARFNHFEAASVLIKFGNADACVEDRENATPLHYSARKKQKGFSQSTADVINLLLESGADINAKDAYESTPLHFAAMRGNEPVTAILLASAHINIEAKDERGATALHEAATYNELEETKLLIEAGCRVYVFDKEHITPLHLAAMAQNEELCRILIENVDLEEKLTYINETDIDNNTALHFAVENRHEPTIRLLVELGADVNLICRPKTTCSTPLHLAAITGNATVIQLLLDNGADPSTTDASRATPLHKAVEYQSMPATKILLQRSPQCVNNRDDELYTPLMIACCYESSSIVKELLNHESDINCTETSEKNCLLLSAEHNQGKVTKVLLQYLQERGDQALINSPDRNGNTALHIACGKGHFDVVKHLCKFSGIELDIKNEEEETSFHIAAQNGFHNICKVLLKKTSCKCLNDEDEDSNTALHMAAQAGHLGVVELLLWKGADKEASNCNQQTPLDYAAEMGHVEIVKFLLENDVPVDGNPADKFQKTPLHLACGNGHSKVVKVLLANGADVSLQDKEELNALDIAVENGHAETATAIVKSDKWRNAMVNASKTKHSRYTPMRRLIRKMPEVAQLVFDKCISRGPHGCHSLDPDLWVEFNFEFLDDTFSHWTADLGEDNMLEQNDLYNAEGKPTTDKEPYCSDGTTLKENHPLILLVHYKQEMLLNHPLVLALIGHKWRVANYFYMAFLLFYITFLSLYSAFVIHAKPPYMVNMTLCENHFDLAEWFTFDDVAKFPIMILAIIGMIIEMFQIIAIRSKYLSQLVNILDWFTYVSAILVVLDFTSCGVQTSWQWQLSAFGVFAAWMDLLLFLRRFPKLGIYVVMVVSILKTFLRFFVIFFLFIVAFGISFYILLQNQAAFRDPFNAIVKTWVMMIGEMDFGDIFHAHVEAPDDPSSQLHYSGSAYAVFIAFLVLMTIIIMNLLTGLAVDDVNELQQHAQLKKLAMQIELALDVEIACPKPLKTWWHCVIGKYKMYPRRQKNSCEQWLTSVEEFIQGPLAKSNYVEAAIQGQMVEDTNDDEVRLNDLEFRISQKVEKNTSQLNDISARLEHMESLLTRFLAQQGGRVSRETEGDGDGEGEGGD